MPAGSRESDANGDLHQQVARALSAGTIRAADGRLAGRLDCIFTTTSQDGDMACDGPGVQHELTLAGVSRPPDKSSKLLDSTKVHKHKWRRDNAPLIPNRADTSWEAVGRQRAPPDRRQYSLVRGSPSHSTTLWQSQPEPKTAGALQPPD